MQSLRSTSLRRLCLSTTASVARVSPNSLPSVLSYSTRTFASSSIRWDQSTSQLYHQNIKKVKKHSPTRGDETAPTKVRTPSSTLHVANLHISTTDEDLREFFSAHGPLHSIIVGRNREGRPYAHVDFETKEDAVKVCEYYQESPVMIGGGEARITFALSATRDGGPVLPRGAVERHHKPSPTIFVGSLPHEATSDDIREALKQFGDVAAVRITTNREGNPRGIAHVDFATTDEAEKALDHYQNHAVKILDRDVRLGRSSPPSAHPPSSTLYFEKWEGDLSSLQSHFHALHDQIVRIHILNPSTPHPADSAGFIEFCDVKTATEALARFNAPGLFLTYARTRGSPHLGSTTREGPRPTGSGFGIKRQYGRRDSHS